MLTKMSWHYTVWLGPSELMILIINEQYGNIQLVFNRMAWQWAETLVEIRGTLADIRGTTK